MNRNNVSIMYSDSILLLQNSMSLWTHSAMNEMVITNLWSENFDFHWLSFILKKWVYFIENSILFKVWFFFDNMLYWEIKNEFEELLLLIFITLDII